MNVTELIDSVLWDRILRYQTFFIDSTSLGDFVPLAKALGLLFATIYLGFKGLEILSGDKDWEIMALLRPFGLALLITNVGLLTGALNKIQTSIITEQKVTVDAKMALIEAKRADMLKLAFDLDKEKAVLMANVESAAQSTNNNGGGSGWFGISLSDLWEGISQSFIVVYSHIYLKAQEFFTWVLKTIFEILVFALMIISWFIMNILSALAPIAVCMSILPAFRSSFTYWLSKYISVMLYPIIGMMMLHGTLHFVDAGITYRADFIKQVTENEELRVLYFAGTGGAANTYQLIAFGIGIISLAATPVIAGWIVRSTGASGFGGRVKRGAGQAASAVSKVATKGAI